MRIRLFGGVAATTDDGQPIDVGPARCQALLAALALSAGSAVPVSRLVERVWGEDPPPTAAKTLQSYVARLRQGLGAGTIVRTGAAYRLDVDADAVDVARFRRHLAAGEVDAALADWTGTPLAGLDAPGLRAIVDGLVEQWLGAVERDLERRVETDAAAVIGTLTELTASHPFHEGLWALLLTALYRAGRQADALATYQRARRHLVDHLGVEPGPRLRELETRILAQDARLVADASSRAAAQEGPPAHRRGNLPRRLGRLIGRADDLEAVATALAGAPVVTLVGPGGVGKTRLALAAARQATDDGREAWLVELAAIASSSDVPRAAAGALGVTEQPGRTVTQAIVADLRERHALVVLDNGEHVLDGAADLAQALAEGCPGVSVLTTSREALGLGDEHLVVVAPLEPTGPGVELFTERARAVSRTFDPDADRAAVEELCRRLDGLPLAIELAAARTRSLTPRDLVERLGDRLRLLGRGRRRGPERHRTLRAVSQWSYDLLTSAEQLLFERLSVFAGPVDRAAAAHVAADPMLDDVDDLLDGLVERSMLVVEHAPWGHRFRLLETMREFAAERLAERGQANLVAVRHARWCLDEVADIHRLLTGPAEADGVARLGGLWADLRAAVDRACTRQDHDIAYALVQPIATEISLRSQHEIGDWAERIVAITPRDDERLILGLTWAAHRDQQTRDLAAFERLLHRCDAPDHPLVRYARAYVANDDDALVDLAPQAVIELRRLGADHLAEHTEINAAGPLLTAGRFGEVDDLVMRLVERYRANGPPTFLNWTLVTLGYSALFQGQPGRAEAFFEEAAGVDLPERTMSVNEPVEARAAFRRGDRTRAFGILRAHVEDLLATDNLMGVEAVCVEFITIAAAMEMLPSAARMLGYLETTGDFGAVAARTVVVEAAGKVAAAGAVHQDIAAGRALDQRQALEFMRDVLDGLVRGERFGP